MKAILILALVVGLVCIPWTYGFITLGMPLWASFLGAASFFACGGGKTGLIKSLPSGLLGIAATLLIIFLAVNVLGGGLLVLSLVVGVIAFIIVVASRSSFFAFMPGTFVGLATTFAIMAAFPADSLAVQGVKAAVGLVTGVAIGYLIYVVNSALSSRLVGN